MLERFRAELGYCSAKVGAEAAIVRDDEHMLLVQRADDRTWSMVAGWVEPGESPHDTVVREMREELGLDVVVDELVGAFGRVASARNGPHGVVGTVHLCSIVGGELRVQEHEILDVAWRDVDDVEEWHTTHEEWARAALARWRERRRESSS